MKHKSRFLFYRSDENSFEDIENIEVTEVTESRMMPYEKDFFTCFKNRDTTVLEDFIKNGAEVNYYQMGRMSCAGTPLSAAVSAMNYDAVKIFRMPVQP